MSDSIYDASFLTQAVIYGDISAVKNAICIPHACEQADVNESDNLKRSPLHAAAYFGQSEIAELLITAGARVDCKDVFWFTPLHFACYSGHKPTLDVLLKYNATATVRDKQWLTPLHVAAANNACDCVQTLMPYLTNINVTDRGGRTSLHHAAYNEHYETTELLIQFGAAVNACDKQYRRPLHWAVQKPFSEVPKLLVDLGADVNARDKNRFSPLHSCSNSVYHVQVLLESGSEIDAKTVNGNTPLHIACLNGYADVVQELIKYSAPLDIVNNYGETPLMLAAACDGGDECFKILLAEGADVNIACKEGQTALHRAAWHGKLGRVSWLLKFPLLIDIPDDNGYTPLHIAALKGQELLFSTLVARGADVHRKNLQDQTALHMCCYSASVECCRLFIKHGLDLNSQDSQGRTALHMAAKKGAIHCLELLVSSGAHLNIPDNHGRIPLHYAAAIGCYEAVYCLVFFGSYFDHRDNDGCLPLHFAVFYDSSGETVHYLLKHCSDTSITDKEGRNLLIYASRGGKLNNLRHVLGAAKAIFKTEDYISSLLVATSSNNADVLKEILPLAGSTLPKTEEGLTPIEIAAGRGFENVLEILLDFYNPTDDCLTLALARAVMAGFVVCVVKILERNVEINSCDENGRTILFKAVFSNKVEIVQLLVMHGADIFQQDLNGKCSLHIAAQCGHYDVLKCLLKHCPAERQIPFDSRGFSLLHWACHRCHPSCIELLVSSDYSSEWGDNPFTPAHAAAMHASKTCLAMILQSKIIFDVSSKDHKGRTPLHIATICNSIGCMKFLLSRNAIVDAVDNEGRTPFQLAAKGALTKALTVLLEAQSPSSYC